MCAVFLAGATPPRARLRLVRLALPCREGGAAGVAKPGLVRFWPAGRVPVPVVSLVMSKRLAPAPLAWIPARLCAPRHARPVAERELGLMADPPPCATHTGDDAV